MLLDEGYTKRQVTKRLDVSNNAVYYSKKRQEGHGNIKLQSGRGRR